MKKEKKVNTSKFSIKKALLPITIGAVLFATPFLSVGCSAGEDGKDGEDGTRWYSGTSNIENVTDGKTGDFYIDTDDYKLYQKNSDGTWSLVMDDFGRPGEAGQPGNDGLPGTSGQPGVDGLPGEAGTSSYTYVKYANTDRSIISSTYQDGLNYISILITDSEVVPNDSDFTVWIKFVGEDGEDGNNGLNGVNGSQWYRGADNIDEITVGEIGDFYIDTDDYKLYQKDSTGGWVLVIDNFGKPGEPGTAGGESAPGAPGISSYTYIRYANADRSIISSIHIDGLDYISILTTTSATEPEDSAFSMWIKFVGDDGLNGTDGGIWLSGTEDVSTVTGGNAGDFYIDTDDYKLYQKNSDGTWSLVMDSFGKPGFNGQPGQSGEEGKPGTSSYTYIAYASDSLGTGFSTTYQTGLNYIGILTTNVEITNLTKDNFNGKWMKFVGTDGEDAISPYIGYDGYFWYGTEQSEHQAVNVYDKIVGDNTIGLVGNGYFENYTITAGSPVALMSNYFETIKKTGYSGVAVSKIHVYVENAGTLTISTAKVADIVNRVGENSVALNNSIKKTVSQGLNVIEFEKPYEISSTDTLVLGALGDTATLVAYKGIASEQVQGSFSNLNSSDVFEKTDGINDKLVLKVETVDKVTTEFIDGFDANIMRNAQGWTDVLKDYTPLVYQNKYLFEDSTVHYISAMTTSVSAIDSNQYITVKLIDIGENGSFTVINTYQFKAKVEDLGLSTTNINCTINYYPDSPLYVGKGQTLAFCSNSDPVQISFKKGAQMGDAAYESMGSGFYYTNWDNHASGENICINVNITKSIGKYYGDNVIYLSNIENDAYVEQTLTSQLNGKYLSILGDSISSFNGYCNDTTNNSTIGDNAYWNFGSMSVNDTWWKQTIDACGMNLLVDNAWSGSTISDARGVGAWYARCENLHANQGELNGTTPDIIVLYMGINDLHTGYAVQTVGDDYNWAQFENSGFTPDTFDEAYAITIYKMQKLYPDAKIFCFTIPKSAQGDGIDDKLLEYNMAIKNIASHYNCEVVDLFSTILSDYYTSSKYTMDSLHPNAGGMDIMTETFMESLKKVYVPER